VIQARRPLVGAASAAHPGEFLRVDHEPGGEELAHDLILADPGYRKLIGMSKMQSYAIDCNDHALLNLAESGNPVDAAAGFTWNQEQSLNKESRPQEYLFHAASSRNVIGAHVP